MKFKVGDVVYLNPKYTKTVDTVRGVITNKTVDWDSTVHVIDYEDGKKGNTHLDSMADYLLLV